MQTEMQTETFVGTAKTAAYLGKPQSWVHNNAERLGIPRYRVGNQYRFLLSEVQLWVKSGQNV